MRFKIGDKLRHNNIPSHTCEITDVFEDSYMVQWDNGGHQMQTRGYMEENHSLDETARVKNIMKLYEVEE